MTDNYSLCESALISRLRDLTDFFPRSEFVTDDDAIVNRGADYYAVVTPDSFPETRVNGREVDFTWNILLDVYVKFTTQQEAKSRFKDIRGKILEHLHPACLNSVKGVSRTVISSNSPILQDAPKNPNIIWQTFLVSVSQRVGFDVK